MSTRCCPDYNEECGCHDWKVSLVRGLCAVLIILALAVMFNGWPS